LLWNNNTYNFLGEIPELQPIKFITETTAKTKSFSSEYSSDIENASLREAAIGLFNTLRIQVINEHKFYDSHLLVYAFRLYDGSTIKQSSPILVTTNKIPSDTTPSDNIFPSSITAKYKTTGQMEREGAYISIGAYTIYAIFDVSYIENYKDIIKSIDIFICPGLGYNSESNIQTPAAVHNGGQLISQNLMFTQEAMIKNIENTSNFYLIDSIELGAQKENYTLKSDKMENLIYQEELKVDDFSHHVIGGRVSYTYNSRLILGNTKTTLFNGFNLDFFLMNSGNKLQSVYNGINYTSYQQYSYIQSTGQAVMILIAVDLKINNKTETVISQYLFYGGLLYFWLNPYFSYPDSRAYKARFYWSTGVAHYLIHEIELKPSIYLNLSYYLSTDSNKLNVLPPIPNKITSITANNFPSLNPEYFSMYPKVTYSEPNKLKVSELNNPFVFPNANTYIIGNGTIIAMASNAIRISEGQFGQYPLYVFTTQGIYSMAVGSGEVVYSNQAAPTSYEASTNGIICSTPFGVVFTSPRGICIISGQEVQLITQQIQQEPQELNLQSHADFTGVLLNFGNQRFTGFLKGIEFIIYNPHENELIICDKESPISYVYSFDSRQIYQSTEKIDLVVQNTFPELYVVEGKKLKDYSESGATDAHVSLITRPLRFSTPDFKRMERMILRAMLFNIKNPLQSKPSYVLNYFSIDEDNFAILRGIPITPCGGRKDFDMGLFARSTYRQFLFAFAGVIDEKSQIQYLETEIEKEYNNTKMR
jgi:hypothetical protein